MVSTNETVEVAQQQVTAVTEQQQIDSVAAEIRTISDEDFERATKLFQSGKKNLFLSKYDEAVNNIADAAELYAAKYGETDTQCAEVYYFYGRALLELARIENTVLGNALTGVPEESGPIDDSRYGNPEDVAEEEKEEIAEKVMDALCSSDEPQTTEPAATTETTTTPAVTETTSTETTTIAAVEQPTTTIETAITEAAAQEGEEEAEGDDDEEVDEAEEGANGGEEKEDAEDISNLQRAWEMFELAKLIYSKNYDNDLLFKNKRIAECMMKLGEIGIEQEIYDQAITDITESIRLQEEIELSERDERMLAESYYQLGLARQFNNLFSDANEAYQRCINIVQLRIEKLRGRLMGLTGEGADVESERTTINDEIAELEALLPEMQSKLEEVTEQGQQALNLIREAKEVFTAQTATTTIVTEANGDVKDITSMVKSKRKIDSTEESTVKKTRLSTEGTEEQEQQQQTENIEVDENKENTAVSATEQPMETKTVETTNETITEPVATA